MATCKCFLPGCTKTFDSVNEDDIAGDGRCPEHKEIGQKVAFKVDIEMSKLRRERGATGPSRMRQVFTEEEIRTGKTADGRLPHFKARDLGIGVAE